MTELINHLFRSWNSLGKIIRKINITLFIIKNRNKSRMDNFESGQIKWIAPIESYSKGEKNKAWYENVKMAGKVMS